MLTDDSAEKIRHLSRASLRSAVLNKEKENCEKSMSREHDGKELLPSWRFGQPKEIV
jgi:hypothetical protein